MDELVNPGAKEVTIKIIENAKRLFIRVLRGLTVAPYLRRETNV